MFGFWSKVRTLYGVRVGKRQVKPWLPSHVPGVRAGNAMGRIEMDPGFVTRDFGAEATSRRSTGISAKARRPIDPRMPNFPPS